MNRHILLFLFIFLGGSSNALASGGHGHDPISAVPIIEKRALNDDERLIQGLLNTYAAGQEKRSVDLVEKAVIAGDFFTIESGYPNWSWEDFKENHLALELEMFSDISYKMDLLVGELQGSLGFAVYRLTATGKLKNNPTPMTTKALGTAILEKTEKGWRIHHIHSSAPRKSGAEHGGSSGHGAVESGHSK